MNRKRYYYYCCGCCRPADKFDIFIAKLVAFTIKLAAGTFIALFAILLLVLIM